MGLGKTIQTIGLVSKTRQNAGDERQKTLIIAPLALIQQWASEFGTKTASGNIKVLVHHGGDRTTNHRDFDDYDVVVTTYQIVASDLAQSGPKKKRGRKRLQKQRQQSQQTLGKEGSDIMDGDLSGDDDTSAVSSRAASPDGQEEEYSQPLRGDGPLFRVEWHRVVLGKLV
jgi:SNF2 family DNA or RNA helicase